MTRLRRTGLPRLSWVGIAALTACVLLACALALACARGLAPAAPAWAEEQAQGGAAASDGAATGSDGAADDAAQAEADSAAQDAAAAAEEKSEAEKKPVTTDIEAQANRVNPQQTPDSSFIYDTPISDLAEADAYLNEQTVQVVGEVVGDRIFAELDPGHCWLTLEATDGTFAEVTLFVENEMAEAVDTFGAYGKRGTIVQARGTFNLSCPDHEGLSDIHVDYFSVVSKGVATKDPVDLWMFVPGFALTAVGGILVFVFYRMRESQR